MRMRRKAAVAMISMATAAATIKMILFFLAAATAVTPGEAGLEPDPVTNPAVKSRPHLAQNLSSVPTDWEHCGQNGMIDVLGGERPVRPFFDQSSRKAEPTNKRYSVLFPLCEYIRKKYSPFCGWSTPSSHSEGFSG